MDIQLIRHATLVLRGGGRTVLVDPMLSPAGAMDPVANAGNDDRIPLTSLPLGDAALRALIATLDGVIVTHLHRDHWDAAARELLPRELPIACQPGDAEPLRASGFTRVTPVEGEAEWLGWRLARTGGEHGRGEVGRKMGEVSGFVIDAAGEPRTWIAGDTVWCPAVEAAIASHRPRVAVVNAGAAQFLEGGPITMDVDDVREVLRAAPEATVVAVHFATVNHCRLSRGALRAAIPDNAGGSRLVIPEDGATVSFGTGG